MISIGVYPVSVDVTDPRNILYSTTFHGGTSPVDIATELLRHEDFAATDRSRTSAVHANWVAAVELALTPLQRGMAVSVDSRHQVVADVR